MSATVILAWLLCGGFLFGVLKADDKENELREFPIAAPVFCLVLGPIGIAMLAGEAFRKRNEDD